MYFTIIILLKSDLVLKTMEKELKPITLPETYKYIAAFLTMRCNLNCSFCLNNLKNSENFNRTKFKELTGKQWVEALNRIKSRDDVPITLSGGEPFLHPDFIYIINNLKPELKIDILTNLSFKPGIKRLLDEVNPERIKRNAPYPSIRVSYHPEQMGDGEEILESVKELQEVGFSIGIESVMYPNPTIIEAIEQMAIQCRNNKITFRPKSFTGMFKGIDDKGNSFSILHGNYSKYPNSVLQDELKKCLCKISELILGPDTNVYRCHRDLFAEENSIGNFLDEKFQIEDKFLPCNNYGQCHPCDVKVKTNSKQELGHTSVEIKEVVNSSEPQFSSPSY